MQHLIQIRGARTHSLKNINLDLPRNQLIVFTGPSGSGKSSLAFDTLFQEGQRRYMQGLSDYAKQFLDQTEKPDVDRIIGLSPTLSVDQKTLSSHPKSTVGTVTELYDFLRLLYAKIGKPICHQCHAPILSQSADQIVDFLFSWPIQTPLTLLAPIFRDKKGEHHQILETLQKKGFSQIRLDGYWQTLGESSPLPPLSKTKKHSLDVVIDRVILKKSLSKEALLKTIQTALQLGNGALIVLKNFKLEEPHPSETWISEKAICQSCQISYPPPEPRLFSFNSPLGACNACQGVGWVEEKGTCPSCSGSRLRVESRHFWIQGQSITDLCELSITDLNAFLKNIFHQFSKKEQQITERLLHQMQEKLQFLTQVGVGYLSLARGTQSLSGGEAQRLRLATQIGLPLREVTYVLDEPSIGLHPQDHQALIHSLQSLRDKGNTVLVVEHDQETMEAADWIVDFGPGAGKQGGNIMAAGTYTDILNHPQSLTGKFLKGDGTLKVPLKRRKIDAHRGYWVRQAHKNTLKNLDVFFPEATFIAVTGVSGSGKSTLIFEELQPNLPECFVIDQKPIGRSPRSNPATYIGLFQGIRDLFSKLPESQRLGLPPGYFSFNVDGGGRCQRCEGAGAILVEMHFLPPVYVPCEACEGKRYQAEALKIKYRDQNMADLLKMTVDEATDFLKNIPVIFKKLKALQEVGLGYLELGQSATTLSGGEAQRLKLATELLQKKSSKKPGRFYLLDEPSTGLHFQDIQKLLEILHALVDQGNTVIVIEHQLDIIKNADYIIDLGPTGGKEGGFLMATGTPEEVAQNPKSATGKFLKKHLSL